MSPISVSPLVSSSLLAAARQPPGADQLRPGDVIYTLAGRRIETPDQLRSVLGSKLNTRLLVHVLRDGEMKHLETT